MADPAKKEDVKAVQAPALPARVHTYVGAGEDPPRKTTVLGQEFVRGKSVKISDQKLLAKLENHPCFVEGEVKMEDLHGSDEHAAKLANEQRKADAATQAAAVKRNGKE